MNEPLSRWIAPEIDEARLARQYAGVAARRRSRNHRPARGRVLAAGLAAAVLVAAVLALVVVVRARPAPVSPLEGMAFETAVGGERVMMADGTAPPQRRNR